MKWKRIGSHLIDIDRCVTISMNRYTHINIIFIDGIETDITFRTSDERDEVFDDLELSLKASYDYLT